MTIPSLLRSAPWIALTVSTLLSPAARAGDASTASDGPAGLVEFRLVRDGRPLARVVVGGEDEPVARAAEDLRRYVEAMSGARLDMRPGPADLPGPTLHIGSTELFEKTARARESIRGDGFALVTLGEDLLVAGCIPQGTANGVTTILQDQFGVRWYHAGPLWETVPRKRSLTIRYRPLPGSTSYVENPSFLGRFYWGGSGPDPLRRHMRLTQEGTPLPYVGTGHALSRVVPLEEYGRSNPEYFALVDGKRVTDRISEPCFTHPDMPDIFMKYVRAGGSSLGINDNLDACRCRRCLDVDGGSPEYLGMPNVSESYYRLVERVARTTRDEHPGRRLGVFAYQLTSSPPGTVDHVGENVDVVLCQDTSQHFDAAVRATDRRMAAEWVRKAGGVSLYDYYGISYWTPRYFPGLMASQIRHLARCGVRGYMTHATTMIDSSMPMFYAYGRLLWNAELDCRELIDEMLVDLYREAAGPMRRFYEHWERCWMRQHRGRWLQGLDDFRAEMRITPIEDIEAGQEILDEAMALCRSDPVRRRVKWLQSRFAFTRVAARAHAASMRAIRSPGTTTSKEACALSTAVVESWRAFAKELRAAEETPSTSASGWHGKTFRVRAWALKQQARDGVLAPLVGWAVANEGRLDPVRLRATERRLWHVAMANRTEIEALVTESIGAVIRRPRAAPLEPADIPRIPAAPRLEAAATDWPFAPHITTPEWVYRQQDKDPPPEKYDEPMVQNHVGRPPETDHSIALQAGWTPRQLYLRIVVTDDEHVEAGESIGRAGGDAIQVTLEPRRERFAGVYDEHSWYFLMGDWRRTRPSFTVALRNNEARVDITTLPSLRQRGDPPATVDARVRRHGSQTVYEIALGWEWLERFQPAAERSFGMSLFVTEVDRGEPPLTAEFGDGVLPRRRPTEFAALRLVER